MRMNQFASSAGQAGSFVQIDLQMSWRERVEVKERKVIGQREMEELVYKSKYGFGGLAAP